MNKEKLELKTNSFSAFKGVITKVNKKKNIITVSLDLLETFKNPPEDNSEIKVLIDENTELQKIIITIKAGEVIEGENEERKDIEMNDLKKQQEVLISPRNPADLYQILELDKLEAEEIVIFEN